MKKLINDPDAVVIESLRGMAAAHPELRLDEEHRVMFRADAPVSGKVALVSGGGSGHEPLHAGYVGTGMLDAAVAGEVFTSPTPDAVRAAIDHVDAGAGVLLIIKNYTGDVLNFQMAADMAREDGIAVEYVVVNDDVAVEDSLYTAGRRGVGLTVLVEKIAGAAAAAGKSLAEVKALAEKVIAQGRSMGVALTAVTLPAVGHPAFDLPEDQIEMGVGIHGEPGRARVPMAPAADIATTMVDAILEDYAFAGNDAIVMVNGMGATPLVELYLFYGEVEKLLAARGVEVRRCLVGNYITSLDMAGASITILKSDDELLSYWDAPVNTPALKNGLAPAAAPAPAPRAAHAAPAPAGDSTLAENDAAETTDAETVSADVTPADDHTVTLGQLEEWVRRVSAAMDKHKDELTELDAAIGDSDHGANMARGTAAAAKRLGHPAPTSISGLGKSVGMALVSSVGGASGPLYGTFFLRFGKQAGTGSALGVKELAAAFRSGTDGVASRGKAAPGDKTMVDVLDAATAALEKSTGTMADATRAAADAAATARQATKDMIAKRGRASYLGERSIGHVDPGAASATLLFEALADVVSGK